MKTIKYSKRCPGDLWKVTYYEFTGTYYLHNTEYELQKYKEKILLTRTITLEEIEKLLDLKSDVVQHDRNMEDCD